jgi:hypothetical protein
VTPRAATATLLLLCLALALAAASATGYLWGHTAARQAAKAQQHRQDLQHALAVAKALNQGLQEGQAAAHALQLDLDTQRTYYTQQLAERARHAPLVVRTACPAAAQPAAPHQPPGLLAAAAHPAPDHPPQPAAGGGVRFTLGAVSVWNSALAGGDVPAGACSAADPSSPACAADAGVDERDVWRNHRVNAQLWAECRQRANALISLLCQRPGQPGCDAQPVPHPHP